MEVKATTKYLRVSPLKARDVAREIQGLPVSQALDVLAFTPRKAAAMVGKTLRSAIANAENNHDLAVDSLVIKEAVVGDAPSLKRYKPRARGSAGAIKKRSSHIFITLTNEVALPEPKKKSGINRKKKIEKRLALAKGIQTAPVKKEAKPEPAEERSCGRRSCRECHERTWQRVRFSERNGSEYYGTKSKSNWLPARSHA